MRSSGNTLSITRGALGVNSKVAPLSHKVAMLVITKHIELLSGFSVVCGQYLCALQCKATLHTHKQWRVMIGVPCTPSEQRHIQTAFTNDREGVIPTGRIISHHCGNS